MNGHFTAEASGSNVGTGNTFKSVPFISSLDFMYASRHVRWSGPWWRDKQAKRETAAQDGISISDSLKPKHGFPAVLQGTKPDIFDEMLQQRL